MSIVTGWRAELAVIDGAQVMMSRRPGSMAWPAFWYEVLDEAHGVALQEDRDRDWVARELGDVPHDRIVGLNCHDNPLSWGEVLHPYSPALPYTPEQHAKAVAESLAFTPEGIAFAMGIPVESLGRDSDG